MSSLGSSIMGVHKYVRSGSVRPQTVTIMTSDRSYPIFRMPRDSSILKLQRFHEHDLYVLAMNGHCRGEFRS